MNDDAPGLSEPVDAPDDPVPSSGPRRLRRIGRRTLVVTAVAVCVAAGGGAIAVAAGGSGSGGSGSPRAGEGPAGGPGGPQRGGGPGGPLLGRSIHGTFVAPSASGGSTSYPTYVQQAGKVMALSATSITLQSKDGYTATYAIGSSTKKDATVKQGGQAMVVATGDPATAVTIGVPGDRPMRGRGGMGGAPDGTPPSGAPGGANNAPGGPAT